MKHNFFTPKTSQQNGMVERKNRSLEELARTMLNENSIAKIFNLLRLVNFRKRY